jgi:hypothetical protein
MLAALAVGRALEGELHQGTGSTNADALKGLVNGVLGEDSCGSGQCLVVGRALKGQASEFDKGTGFGVR